MTTAMGNRYWDDETVRIAQAVPSGLGTQGPMSGAQRPVAPGAPDHRLDVYGPAREPAGPGRAAPVEPRPGVDATRLWSGGMATAIVAGLIGLVGVLVVRAAFHIALFAPAGAAALGSAAAVTTLCLLAAAAALTATGLAQLLIVTTPRPLAYLGWIVGLATAAATVAPLLGGVTAVAVAQALIHLVIGLAIGSLVAGSAAAATRPARRY